MPAPQVAGPSGPIERQLFERAATQLTAALSAAWMSPSHAVREDLAGSDGVGPSAASEPIVAAEEIARRLDGWLGRIVAGTGADMGSIQVFDAATSTLRIRAHRGFKTPFLEFFREVYIDDAACGTAFSSRATVIVSDVATSPLFSAGARQVMLEAEARAVQSSNLSTPKIQRIGVVSVHYRRPGVPEESQRQLRRFTGPLAEMVALFLPARPQS